MFRNGRKRPLYNMGPKKETDHTLSDGTNMTHILPQLHYFHFLELLNVVDWQTGVRGFEPQMHKHTLGVKIKRIIPHLAAGNFQLKSAQSQ